METKYIPVHKSCPYYDDGKHACSREGCIFLTPCLLVNGFRQLPRKSAKKGKR